MKHVSPRALRGATSFVRADVTDPKALIDELNKAFAEFKTNHTEQLKEIKAGYSDVVKAEKVDRINAEVDKLSKATDDIYRQMAAIKVGGAGGNETDPDKRAHAAAFDKFFRKGVDAGLRELEVKAAVSTDNDPNGGYLAPDEMEATIDRVLSTVSTIRGISQVITISGSAYKKLVGLGGATAGWVGERQTRAETSTPTLAELAYEAKELYALPYATQTALDDSRIDIGQWLADEVSITFAEKEGLAFFSGDGVLQPRGLNSYTKVANASYAWGSVGYIASGVGSALTDSTHNGIDPMLDMIYGLKQGYRQNARWLMNRSTQATVRKIKDTTGQYLWQPPVQAGQPASLLGYPVSDDDNISDIGANAYPIWFGDFRRAYLIVDRAGIRVLRDPYTNKPYVGFYTTKRVGGGMQNFEAIKVMKIATS